MKTIIVAILLTLAPLSAASSQAPTVGECYDERGRGFEHCASKKWYVDLGRDALLWQVRSCLGETGFNRPLCAAMTHAHGRRAKRLARTHRLQTRLYSVALKDSSRRWINEIRLDGDKPKHWKGRKWDRDKLLSFVDFVRDVFMGAEKDPCQDESPEHYAALWKGPPISKRKFKQATCLVDLPTARKPQVFWVER